MYLTVTFSNKNCSSKHAASLAIHLWRSRSVNSLWVFVCLIHSANCHKLSSSRFAARHVDCNNTSNLLYGVTWDLHNRKCRNGVTLHPASDTYGIRTFSIHLFLKQDAASFFPFFFVRWRVRDLVTYRSKLKQNQSGCGYKVVFFASNASDATP